MRGWKTKERTFHGLQKMNNKKKKKERKRTEGLGYKFELLGRTRTRIIYRELPRESQRTRRRRRKRIQRRRRRKKAKSL